MLLTWALCGSFGLFELADSSPADLSAHSPAPPQGFPESLLPTLQRQLPEPRGDHEGADPQSMEAYNAMLTESQQVRTLLSEDVNYLAPAAADLMSAVRHALAPPARTPEDREAARQRVMRHVTE